MGLTASHRTPYGLHGRSLIGNDSCRACCVCYDHVLTWQAGRVHVFGSLHACLLRDCEHDIKLLVGSVGLHNILHDFQYGGHGPLIIASQGCGSVRADDVSIHHRSHILTRLNLVQMGYKAEGRITWLALDMGDNISAISSICLPGFIYGSLYSPLLKIVHKPLALLLLPAGRAVNLNQFQKTFLHPFP